MSSKTDSVRVAKEANKDKFSSDKRCDTDFAVYVADAGILEAKMSELAQINASTAATKNLAFTMEKVHSKEHNELKGLAARKNITLPDKLSEKSQKSYDCLAKKQGKKFDRTYLKCTKKASKKELCEFRKEAKKGKDPEVKAWAAQNVSAIKDQVAESKDACKKMKDEK